MKSIKQIREEYDILTEKDNVEDQKLTSLVRAGLYDAKKLPALKKALDKNVDKMSPQEKRMISSLLDSLITQVVHNDQVYRKVRQNVMKEDKSPKTLSLSSMPSILVLKRKAVRVYPNSQYVGLYYSQQIDKYVAVPFGDIDVDKHVLSMNEETLDEVVSPEGENAVFAKRTVATRESRGKKREQNLKKAAKTAIRAVSKAARKNGVKAGEERMAKMGEFADKYHNTLKSMKQRQTATTIKRKTQQPAKKPVAPAAPAAAAPVNSPAPETSTKDRRTSILDRNRRRNAASALDRRPNKTARKIYKTLNKVRDQGVAGTLGAAIGRAFMKETVELNLDGNKYQLNKLIAEKVQGVYESLNKKNQKKMVSMMNESTESLNKIISFALRQ